LIVGFAKTNPTKEALGANQELILFLELSKPVFFGVVERNEKVILVSSNSN